MEARRPALSPWQRLARWTCWTVMILVAAALACPGGMAATTSRFNSVQIARNTKHYTIDVKYPAIAAPRNAAERAFNLEWRRRAQQQVAQFVKLAPEMRPGAAMKSSLDLAYEVRFDDGQLVSVVSQGGEFTGGAHPNPIVESGLFDLRRGRSLTLGDLFRARTDYLGVLSKACAQELKRRQDLNSDDDWIEKGAAPTDDNYRVFQIKRHSLVVIFPPYQVAPYSSGIQEVEIPLRDLQRIIDPRGPLGRLR